jgi:hypothetical protein
MSSELSPYAKKLRSPLWQKLRLKIMERDAFTCRHCRSKENTLNVHHSFYLKGKAPWEYDENTLITLCEDCHKQVESTNRLLLSVTGQSNTNRALLLAFAEALSGTGPMCNRDIMWMAESAAKIFQSFHGASLAQLEGDDGLVSEFQESINHETLEIISRLHGIREFVRELMDRPQQD